MEAHFFLVLSLLLLVPGFVIALVRPDLRRDLAAVTPWSLPFAATEALFYPVYWQPTFLFDLARHLGFGIEDVLFVAGLAWLAAGSYPAVFRRRLAAAPGAVAPGAVAPGAVAPGAHPGAVARPQRGAFVLAGSIVVFVVLWTLRMHVFYACIGAMALMGLGVVALRRDLALPMLGGAAVTFVVYTFLCWVLDRLVPGVFERHWRTQELLGRTLFGVPLEESLYGACAGAVGTAFLPFVRQHSYVPLAGHHGDPWDAKPALAGGSGAP